MLVPDYIGVQHKMALSDIIVIDKIEILEDETIQVRRARRIFDGGELVAERYHRTIFVPTTPLNDIPFPRVRAIANLIWTPQVIQAYRDKIGAG